MAVGNLESLLLLFTVFVVLGLNRNGALPKIEIDGEPPMSISNAQVSTTEHKYLYW